MYALQDIPKEDFLHSQKEPDRRQGRRHEEKECFGGSAKAQGLDFHREGKGRSNFLERL